MSEELDERQIDAKIDSLLFGHRVFGGKGDYFRSSLKANPTEWEVPHYSSDISAAYAMEERIKELGLQEEYANALVASISRPPSSRTFDSNTIEFDLFDLIHASPLERAKAAVEMEKR